MSGAVAHKRVSSFAPSSLESSAHHQGRSGQLSACTPRTSNSEPARLGQEQPGKSFHHHLEGKPSSEISSLLQQALHQRDFVRLRYGSKNDCMEDGWLIPWASKIPVLKST